MQNSYYDSSVGFLQESLEMIGENLAYGFFTINDFIKVSAQISTSSQK
jgi:hypothetical protein